MLGAVIGDIAGSRFEFDNLRSKDFVLLSKKCWVTDDSIMSLAIAEAIMESKDPAELGRNAVKEMRRYGAAHPDASYGASFREWLFTDDPQPYSSWGNGSAMRVSAISFAADNEAEVRAMSRAVTWPTHNHPEGLKGAKCAAMCGYYARKGKTRDEIRKYVEENFYPLDFTVDGIRETYVYNESCQGTVPQAIVAFLEAEDFEDAIRNAVSIGGDSDTLAAITGGIAECFWGIPKRLRNRALSFLTPDLVDTVERFEALYPPKNA